MVVAKSQGTAFLLVMEALRATNCDPLLGGEGQVSALCPAHEDRRPSLSITASEASVLINCHAGCAPEEIVRALGLTMVDLYDNPHPDFSEPSSLIQEYVYCDEAGMPLFKVDRYEPKSFRQHRWNGGSWDNSLGDARRVLYRLPQLITAVAARKWVFVVEGEKDADRLISEGLVATTIPMGANAGNWDKTDTSVLDGAFVAVIGDNDAPGRKYARHVANSLSDRAAEVRLIQLPELSDKGDISDWLDQGFTAADLASIVNATVKWEKKRKFNGAEPFVTVGGVAAYRADSLRSWAKEQPKWRVRGVLIEGTHLVVGASKKTLKTTLVSGEMAFAIANGTNWLGHPEFVVEAQTPVVVVINEGMKSYMRALDRIPARERTNSLGPIVVIDASGSKLSNGDLDETIREAADRVGAGVIIYDAWYGFVGGDTEPSNLFAMSDTFKIVQDVADSLGLDPIVVHHLKKNSSGRPDLDDLTFAGIAEWADSWLLVTHRESARPDDGEYRLGLVAGSRQWGELEYEVDVSFGPIEIDSGGYTRPPTWIVARVTAEQSQQWGRKATGSAVNSRTSLTDFIKAHPFEYTRSQVSEMASGGERANRDALASLIEAEEVEVVKRQRPEGARNVLRELVGPVGSESESGGQGRLAPIGDGLPTFVGEHGAGNSPGAAVSAPSEPPTEVNPGKRADVENAYLPTLTAPTINVAHVVDQVQEEDVTRGEDAGPDGPNQRQHREIPGRID